MECLCIPRFVTAFGLLAVLCQGLKLELIMRAINRCPGLQYSKMPIGLEDLRYSQKPNSGSYLVNGFAIIRKDVTDAVMELEVSRCVSEEIDSCRQFMSLNCTELCDKLGKENMIWTTIFENTKGFPKNCPIAKGRYQMIDAYLDLNKAHEGMSLPPGHWMAKIKFYDQKELLLCHYVIASIKLARKRKTTTQ